MHNPRFLIPTVAIAAAAAVAVSQSWFAPARAAQGFSNASIKGAYSLSISGLESDSPADDPTTIQLLNLNAVGAVRYDGRGNFSATETANIGASSGALAQKTCFQNLTGSYAVKPDGTGTSKYTSSGTCGTIQLTNTFVVSAGGKDIDFVVTSRSSSPDTIVNSLISQGSEHKQ
jgi:hypothetical protein